MSLTLLLWPPPTPPTGLTKKYAKLIWEDDSEHAFPALKKMDAVEEVPFRICSDIRCTVPVPYGPTFRTILNSLFTLPRKVIESVLKWTHAL